MGLLPTKYPQTLFSAAFQIKRLKESALCLWLRLRTATRLSGVGLPLRRQTSAAQRPWLRAPAHISGLIERFSRMA